jgi:hypothetical protein
MKKRKSNPKGKNLRSSLNNSSSKTHAQGPSTATCTVLTNYHNTTTTFISSQQKVEGNVKINAMY